ncbi:MAG: hypothetical protein C5B54_09430 [Acidobacteria bacterium]|nr:MAG: hypothetical protein C5B54_09430 [Acidobacteriota bacterium]
MPRGLLCVLIGLTMILVSSAESYTVILKNGKVLKGTLLSENDSIIVFKDDQGLQFSLKKSLLDLDKTRQANEPPPEPPAVSNQATDQPGTVQTQTPPAKKEAKVYTAADLNTVPKKTNEITPGKVTVEYAGVLDNVSYYQTLESGLDQANDLIKDTKALTLDLVATWEAALSTGKRAQPELDHYLTAGEGYGLLESCTTKLDQLKIAASKLSHAPKGYETVPQPMNRAVELLSNYVTSVKQHETGGDIARFHKNLDSMTEEAQSQLSKLREVKEVPQQQQ